MTVYSHRYKPPKSSTRESITTALGSAPKAYELDCVAMVAACAAPVHTPSRNKLSQAVTKRRGVMFITPPSAASLMSFRQGHADISNDHAYAEDSSNQKIQPVKMLS